MATKSFLFMRNFLCFSLCGLLLACAPLSLRRSQESSTKEVSEPKANASETSPPLAPRLAVILGPGLGKISAHLAVMSALQQERIPITEIHGLGWGALVAAAYANEPMGSGLKWQWYKLKDKDFPQKSLFAGSYRWQATEALAPLLAAVFGQSKTKDLSIKFTCPYRQAPDFNPGILGAGLLQQKLRACLGGHLLFEPYQGGFADPLQLGEMIASLRQRQVDKILLIDVLSAEDWADNKDLFRSPAERYLWGQFGQALQQAAKQVDYYVKIDTSGSHMAQWHKRRDWERQGAEDFQRSLPQIRRDLLGR